MIRAAVVSKNQSWRSFLRFAELQRGKRTGSVLAAADLDELLDVGDFGRHFGGVGGGRVGKIDGKSLEVANVNRAWPNCGARFLKRAHGLPWGARALVCKWLGRG